MPNPIPNPQSAIPNYKILAAKRLAVLPEEFAFYRETTDQVIVTTIDQVEHTFTKSELERPATKVSSGEPGAAIPVAKTALEGPNSASAEPAPSSVTSKKPAKPKGKSKS